MSGHVRATGLKLIHGDYRRISSGTERIDPTKISCGVHNKPRYSSRLIRTCPHNENGPE